MRTFAPLPMSRMVAGDLSLTSLRTAKDVSDARARIVQQGQGRMPPRIACGAADHHGDRIRAQEPDLPRRGLREPDLPDAARPFDAGRLGEADVAGKRARRAQPDAHGCGGGAAHIPQPCAEGLDPLPAQIADADCVWGGAADRREPFEEGSERVAAAFGRVRAQVPSARDALEQESGQGLLERPHSASPPKTVRDTSASRSIIS